CSVDPIAVCSVDPIAVCSVGIVINRTILIKLEDTLPGFAQIQNVATSDSYGVCVTSITCSDPHAGGFRSSNNCSGRWGVYSLFMFVDEEWSRFDGVGFGSLLFGIVSVDLKILARLALD
ncbi:hypothetical protein A2U01_0013614, partial [Trifolium medium]|nr:hypothetical protein [Trifolium medium]